MVERCQLVRAAIVRRSNPLAYTGALLAILELLINPFGILSVLGIVFSSIGLAKANDLSAANLRITGRGTAILGLVVGIVEVTLFAYRLLV
jgi:membrane-bound ClpP family serine protease